MPAGTKQFDVTCPGGKTVLSGGYNLSAGDNNTTMVHLTAGFEHTVGFPDQESNRGGQDDDRVPGVRERRVLRLGAATEHA